MTRFLVPALLCACTTPKISETPGEGSSALLSDPDLSEFITERMGAARVPGLSAAIIRDGEVQAVGAWGLANVEEDRPVDTDTLFNLASVSKTFIAVAVMMAVEDGALDLDEDVSTWLPFDVEHPYSSKAITLRMLMTHTSGISDNWDVLEDLYVEGDSPIGLGEFLEGYLVRGGEYYDPDWNFDADPGEAADYSNVGASLAAYVVEAATGTPFDTYCERHIFAPLGMDDAGWHLSDLDTDQIAMPYGWVGGAWEPYGFYGYPDYPDGNLRTTAPQLGRFLAAITAGGTLDGERLLKASSVASLLTSQVPDLEDLQGLMWYGWQLGDDEVWGHNGGDDGVATEILFRPTDGAGVVLLMNGDADRWGPVEDIEMELLDLALR